MGKFKQFLNETNLFSQIVTLLIEGTGLPIKDLIKNAPSDMNKKFSAQRKSQGKTGSKLVDVIWYEKNDTLTLKYDVTPTFNGKVKTVSKTGNESTANKYVVEIQFEDVEEFLGSKKDFFSVLTKKEQVELFNILVKDGTVKLSSNDSSWYWQGAFQNASELGFSIYPFKSTKGKGIWKKRHANEFYITKHIMEVLTTIPFISTNVVKILRDKHQK